MKSIATLSIWIAALTLVACGRPPTQKVINKEGQAITCEADQVPVYSNRFTPQAGASGVAAYSDAAAGKTQSEPSAAVPAQNDPAATAMAVACGQANCADGQVAVELPPPASGGGFGGVGAPSGGADDTAGPTPPAPPEPAPAPTGTVVCVPPPPACAAGLSPQYLLNGTWECTDCTLVVTYGGIYSNYRRCVGMPQLQCGDGQVPTWIYEDEKWECKTTCDNGQYDQHTIGGVLVCVPC